MSLERFCCHLACGPGHPAEWMIVSGASPDDYTEACTQHVGELLVDAPEQRIYRISAPASGFVEAA